MHSQQPTVTQMRIKTLFLIQYTIKSKKKSGNGSYFTFISQLATVLKSPEHSSVILTPNSVINDIDYKSVDQIINDCNMKVNIINRYNDKAILNIILIIITTKRKLHEILPSVLISARSSGIRT